MDDFKRMDSLTETKLTRAILKAATLAIGSDLNRSKLLALQLKKDDIPKLLTKTATAAFNRRLSVITLGKRNLDTKADSFELADYDTVALHRGCPSLLKKASVVNAPFKYSVSKPVMEKKASVVALEKTLITVLQALKKMASYVDKTAILFQEAMHDLQQLEVVLNSLIKKASKELNEDIRTGRLLATVYGDSYRLLFKDKVNLKALLKHAEYAILPKNMTVELVLKAIQQSDVVSMKKELIQLKKNAAEMVAKDAIAFLNLVQEMMMQGMSKKAALSDMPREALVNMVTVPGLVVGGAAEGAFSTASDYAKDMSALLSQRYAINPLSAITAKLMNTDRYDDKVNRLTDILADEDFKNYRVLDIEAAVSAAISLHPEFISPRYKLFLKTAVSNRLIAGGKTNTATQAALALLLKRIAEGDKLTDETSIAKRLRLLKAVEGKDIDIAKLLPRLKMPAKTITEDILPVYNLHPHKKLLFDFIDSYWSDKELRDQKFEELRLKGILRYMTVREKAVALAEAMKLKLLQYYMLGLLRKHVIANKQFTEAGINTLPVPIMQDILKNPSTIAAALKPRQFGTLRDMALQEMQLAHPDLESIKDAYKYLGLGV